MAGFRPRTATFQPFRVGTTSALVGFMTIIELLLWLSAFAVHAGEPGDIDAELAQLLDEALMTWPPTVKA